MGGLMGKEKSKEKKKLSPKQLFEALREQKIITSLSDPKGINELQYLLSESDEDTPPTPVPKSTISNKLKRLKNQKLIIQHKEHVEFEELANPKYRGWRNIKEYENGSKDLEFGFKLTPNGNRALEILKDNIEPFEETKSKKPKKED